MPVDVLSSLVIIFFQAEDGIRDGHVTGVQTCALPISEEIRSLTGDLDLVTFGQRLRHLRKARGLTLSDLGERVGREIGRASCREREKRRGAAGAEEEEDGTGRENQRVG